MKIVQQMYSSTLLGVLPFGGSTLVFCCVLHGSSARDGLRFSSPLFSTSPSFFYAVQVHSRLNRNELQKDRSSPHSFLAQLFRPCPLLPKDQSFTKMVLDHSRLKIQYDKAKEHEF